MSKGFSGLLISLILAGMTLVIGFGGSETIKESQTDGCHNATILLRDISSGLLWMEIEANENISTHLKYEEMPESMTFNTEEDIIYYRDDGETITGLMTKEELFSWLRCRNVR